MTIALGLLQDEYALTGEYQIFQGWAERVRAARLPARLFSPAGERLRADGFRRHETGESLWRTFREQWLFIEQACAIAPSVGALHVFVPTPNFLWIADRVKKACGKPVVATCLSERAELSGPMDLGSLWGALRFHLIRHAASRLVPIGRFLCDRYVAGTESVAEQLRRAGCRESVITVQLPLPPEEGLPDEASLSWARGADPERTFLYLGHFLPSKGVDCLLKGFAELGQPATRLALAWSGLGSLPDVQALCRRLGIEGRVSILDFAAHRSTLFSRARALVLPYPVSYGQTSPPMALVEAYRAGVPVVVSGLRPIEALGEEGEMMYTFKPGDWRGLAGRLRHLLDHPQEAEKMRRAQRERFRRLEAAFDPRRFYEGVLSHGG